MPIRLKSRGGESRQSGSIASESYTEKNHWYSGSKWPLCFVWISWVYFLAIKARYGFFKLIDHLKWRAPVPVIVVGNITVGGTGKTTFVIWLANWLQSFGLKPGVISRGYGGAVTKIPSFVDPTSDPSDFGEEAVLISSQTGCPVVICKNRVKAAKYLLGGTDVDIILTDDGLQHYSLSRDLEIVLIDGIRKFGNGFLLPAGPMREQKARLRTADWIIVTEKYWEEIGDQTLMQIEPLEFISSDGKTRLSVSDFVHLFPMVNAVAGIGNPGRFYRTLVALGLKVALLRELPDHHRYNGTELVFPDNSPIIATMKDMIKINSLDYIPSNLWYLKVSAQFDSSAEINLKYFLQKLGLSIG